MTVGGINVDITYKDIKNLHIGVYPPMGRVRVAAPRHLDEEQVRLAVVQRLPWIKRHQRQLQEAERQSPREMVTGESHYVWGRRHRLEVVERPGRPKVEISGERLVMYVPEGSDEDQRQRLLERWLRRQLQERIRMLIEEWQPKVESDVAGWTVRRMKTKWGSCNRETAQLWFNLELAKKHPRCIEYLVVHEMTHLLERGHGDRFTKLMDQFMPDWRARRDDLNNAPLAHEVWA
jgi:predicted metal-dependent hydrolase